MISQKQRLYYHTHTLLLSAATAVLTGYLVSRYAYKGCISSEGFLSAMRHIDTSPTDKPNNDSELH
jgi:hypothetical protein